MLYNYEKDLKSAEERIKSSGISEANKQLIFEFESNCFAEGLRISRTLHLTELKVFTEMFGKELKDASKLDILKMIERIERMDRSDRMVDGKTGMRRVRIIFSSPYLATWLETHPFRDNPESFVWVGIGTVGRNVPMRYDAIRMHLKRIAKRAVVKKRIHPHLFRHSRSTHLAKHLTEAQMKQYLGWVQVSEMAAIYVHLSGRDVDNALLKMHYDEFSNYQVLL